MVHMRSSSWTAPDSMFTHLRLRTPVKICVPPMANINRKNNKMSMISNSREKADIKLTTMTLSPDIPEMVLRGHNTLKDLSVLKFESALIASRIYEDTTIVKSRMFHGSLRYEPRFSTKPNPHILNNISAV